MNNIETIKALEQAPYSRENEARLIEAYRRLPVEEGRLLAAYAVALLDTNRRFYERTCESILLKLACLVPGALNGFHARLAQHEVFYPGDLFRGADPETRDDLLRRVETDDDSRCPWPQRGHLLRALAWIGDEVVQETFRRWRASPPAWRSSIYVPPEDYAMAAGWQLTESGERRLLFSQECYQIVAVDAVGPDAVPGPVEVVTPHPDRCDWCGRSLIVLFSFDSRDARLAFLDLSEPRLQIATCERCSAYATVFMDLDASGNSHWSPANVKPEFIGYDLDEEETDYYALPQRRLVLGPRRRSPFEAHPFVLQDGASQIGGFPTWIQDAEFPLCPRCRLAMPFVGQVQTSDLGEPAEGVTYAFVCRNCRTAATSYQQT